MGAVVDRGHNLRDQGQLSFLIESKTLKPSASMALITLLLGVLLVPVMGQALSDTCNGGDSCCDSGGCLAGEGDCDKDSHCAGDLICGKDNCYGDDFDRTDDCCVADPSPNPIVNVNGTDGMDITVTLSCYGLKRAHEAIIRAQL